MTNEIKKAFESAEQEIQEKYIAQLKGTIKDLLEKKSNKEKEKRDIEKEISVIKQTIDDFKAGRLDKVKELQEKDEVADRLLPFKIVIINQPIITQPWGWTYKVVQTYPQYSYTTVSNAGGVTCYSGNDLTNNTTCSSSYFTSTGSGASTFTGGTYNLGNGRIINL